MMFKPTTNTKLHLKWQHQLPAVGLLIALSFLVLFSRSEYADSLSGFYSLMSVCYVIVFGFALYLWKSNQSLSVKFVFIWSVIFHLLGVLGSPLFEDDYFRYLWDAYHTAQTGSPYGVAPSAYFSSGDTNGSLIGDIPDSFQNILGQINYPDIPTIYGPTLQYSFLLAYLISPGELWPLQLLYAVVDLALIILLLKMAPARLVILYAWSPLVFKEVLLTAHPDGLGVFFLIASVYYHHHRLYMPMVVCLALSLAAKVFAVLFLPFLLFKTKPRHLLIFISILLVIYAPLLTNNGSDLLGLSAMAQNWEFNSALFALLRLGLDTFNSKLVLAVFLLLFFSTYFYRFYLQENQLPRADKNIIPRGDWIMGAFLICAPVINPWYLLWILPFAVIYSNLTAWVASVAILLAYVVGLNLDDAGQLGPYEQPIWVRLIEYTLIFISAIFEWHWKSSRIKPATHKKIIVK